MQIAEKALSTFVASSAEVSTKLEIENSLNCNKTTVFYLPEVVISRESLCTFKRHRPLLDPVALIAHQHDGDVPVVGVVPHVLHPPHHAVVALLLGDVVHHDGAHGVPVVGRGDGPVPLLARRVPDLQLDLFAVQLNCADLEVNTFEILL